MFITAVLETGQFSAVSHSTLNKSEIQCFFRFTDDDYSLIFKWENPMLRIVLILTLILPLSAVSAQAPELAGKNRLSLHGGLDFLGPNGDNIDFKLGYGWFLRDDLLVGGEYLWAVMEDIAPGESDYRSQQASLVVEWLFIGKSKLAPYAGVEVGFRRSKFNEFDESGLVYGGRVGVRYFLTESVSINGSISMLQSGKDVFIVDFEAEDQYIFPSFGISAEF